MDTEWDAVFISPDTARILDLPRGVRAAFPQFVPRTCPAPPRGPVTPARGGKGKGNAPATGSGRLGRACDGEEAQAARPRKKARQGSGARERTAAEAAAADGEEGALARFLASQQQQQQQQQQPQPQQPPAALHAPGAREQANGVHADGSDSGSDGEAPPSPQRRGRPAAHVGRQRPPPVGRQRLPPDYSHVPDPEGAPLAGRLKRLQLQHFVVSWGEAAQGAQAEGRPAAALGVGLGAARCPCGPQFPRDQPPALIPWPLIPCSATNTWTSRCPPEPPCSPASTAPASRQCWRRCSAPWARARPTRGGERGGGAAATALAAGARVVVAGCAAVAPRPTCCVHCLHVPSPQVQDVAILCAAAP